MAVFFRLLQNKNEHCAASYGKWYARALHLNTIDNEQLADIMQQNCSMKRSDIAAVICELAETMTRELQNGHRVKIRGLGTFKIGFSSEGVSNPDDFRPDKHVHDMHINFQPEVRKQFNGQRFRALLTGAKAQELPKSNR